MRVYNETAVAPTQSTTAGSSQPEQQRFALRNNFLSPGVETWTFSPENKRTEACLRQTADSNLRLFQNQSSTSTVN